MDKPDTEDRERLGTKTRRGVSWNLAGATATNVTRIAVLAILGRALSSHDFGVVAAAVSVNTIVYSVRDIGVGPALVQRKDLDPQHVATAFAVSTYVGVLLAAILWLAAPLIGRTFHISESTGVIRALAVLFVLRNAAATSRMMSRREMNFRLVTLVDTSSFVIGSIVSMVSVLVIGGPWSLVVGYWTEEVIATALYLTYRPPPFTLKIDRRRLRELMDFGAGQTVTSITNIGAMYGDNVVVGHVLGAKALGYYSRAFDLIRFPALVFEAVVGNVLFSAFSRLQEHRESLVSNFRRVMFVNALVLVPASTALIVLAPETIRVLIGPDWTEAITPFRILAVTIVIRTNQKLGALVAQSVGAVNAVAVSFTIYMLAVVGGAAFSIRWGIPGVSTTTSIAAVILCVECCVLAAHVSKSGLLTLVRAHIPGLLLAALVISIGWPIASVARERHLAAPLTLIVVLAPCILACSAVVVIGLKLGVGDFQWLRREMTRWTRRAPLAKETAM